MSWKISAKPSPKKHPLSMCILRYLCYNWLIVRNCFRLTWNPSFVFPHKICLLSLACSAIDGSPSSTWKSNYYCTLDWTCAVVMAQLVEWSLPTTEIRSSNPVIHKFYLLPALNACIKYCLVLGTYIPMCCDKSQIILLWWRNDFE